MPIGDLIGLSVVNVSIRGGTKKGGLHRKGFPCTPEDDHIAIGRMQTWNYLTANGGGCR